MCNFVVNLLVQIENIVWDEFDESSYHTVPHQGGKSVNEAVALGDFLKKPQYEVGNDAGKSTSSRGSKNKDVLLGKEEIAFCPSSKGGTSTVSEGSWTHASRKVVPAFHDPNSFNSFTSLTSQDGKFLENCFNNAICIQKRIYFASESYC